MQFDASNTYQNEVRYMFSRMQKTCDLFTNASCGTHIHLSPGDGTWRPKELKRVCKAILYFEEAMEVLYPQARRGSHFCRSNRFDNEQLARMDGARSQPRDMAECFRAIDKCDGVRALSELMTLRKYMAWNFIKVYHGGRTGDGATIEFRRPPGVANADDCLGWVELAVHFIHAALQLPGPDFLLDERYPRDVAGLEAFLHDGLADGAPKPMYLQKLFHGKAGRIQPVLHYDQLEPGDDPSSWQPWAGRGDFLSVVTSPVLQGLFSPLASPCVTSPFLMSPTSLISVM